MRTAKERVDQLSLVSRLKTTYPEVPEWPTPEEIDHKHYFAYLKTPHDIGGELEVPLPYIEKQEEEWELMTYVLCEVLAWRGIWVSEERRRLANVDLGRSAYLGTPYYARWLYSVGKLLIEKNHMSWGEFTNRLAEVRERYADGLKGRLPEAKPKFAGDGNNVKRNKAHTMAMGVGDPIMYSGKAAPAKFKVGDKVRVLTLPAMFYTRTPEYVRGAEGVIASLAYESPAPEDEAWNHEDAKPEWFYVVRFKQTELWDIYTGHKNDTLQTEIPESWLAAAK